MLPREDDLPQDLPHYFDPPARDEVPPSAPVSLSAPSSPGRSEARTVDVGSVADWPIDSGKPPPALSGAPSVGAILQGLKRRWWLALGIGSVVGLVAAAAAWVFLEPPYTAFAQVRAHTVQPGFLRPDIDMAKHRNEYMSYQKLQASHIRGRQVLNAALTRPEVKSLALVKEQPDPLLWLEEQIRVEFQETSEVMTINMTSTDAEAARALVNAVREAYFDEVILEERRIRIERMKELEKIVEETAQKLGNKRDSYIQLAEQLGSQDSQVLSTKQTNLLNSLNSKRATLDKMQLELKLAQSRLKVFEDLQPPTTVGPMTPAPAPMSPMAQVTERMIDDAVSHDPMVRQLTLELRRAEVQWISAQKHLFPSESEYAQIKKSFRQAQSSLEKQKVLVRENVIAEMNRLNAQAATPQVGPGNAASGPTSLDQAKAEILALKGPIDDLDKEVKLLTEQSEKFNQRSADLERLRDEKNGEAQRLGGYKDQLEALRIELRPNLPSRVVRFQEAGLQKRDTKRQLLGAIVVPLVVLVGVAFGVGWWESRARRINSADEVARGLGVRVVGAVPAFPRRGRKDEETFEHLLTESIDNIRTQLLREADVEPMQVVMVTSAAAGEGKTTVASQLAGSLARAGRRTLLIDCDLRRPAAHQLFELPQQPGLSEVLLGEVHVAEATLATEVDGLWMVPAGDWDREVITALAKDAFANVLTKLRQAYDFIVIDSHPVLAATDSLLIGQHADAVLMAVMRDVSQSPKVYAALQRLASLHIYVLGAVVSGLPEQAVVNGSYNCAAPVMR